MLATRIPLCIAVLLICLLSVGITQSLSGEGEQPSATGWKIKFNESGSNPVLVDGVLYVGSADGGVYALDPATGETKWRFQTGENLSPATSGPQVITVPRGTSMADQMAAAIDAVEKRKGEGIRRVEMTPAVENGTVFIGSGDQSFYAIDAATGKKKWSYLAGPGMASRNFTSDTRPPAVIKNGTVYFATEDGLHALDALTGERKWLFEALQETSTEQTNLRMKRAPNEPVMGDGVIFLTAGPAHEDSTPLKTFVYALDPESGKTKWVTKVDGLEITAPTTAKGLVFFTVKELAAPTEDGATLYAIDAAGGQVKWKVGAKRMYGTSVPLIAGNTIYFSTDKSLSAVELETGRQLWTFSADEISGGAYVGSPGLWVDDKHLYVVTHKGSIMRPKDTLHALAITTGQETWSESVSGSVRVALVRDGVVYADGAHPHAIDAATGKELWSYKEAGRQSVRLMSGDRIYLTSPTITYTGTKRADQGYLYAIDAKTGNLKPAQR